MAGVFIPWKSASTTNWTVKQWPAHHWLCLSGSWDLPGELGIGACTHWHWGGQNYSHFELMPWISLSALWQFLIGCLEVLWFSRSSDTPLLPTAFSLTDATASFMTVGLSSPTCILGVTGIRYHLVLLQMCMGFWFSSTCFDVRIQKFKDNATTVFPESTSWMTSKIRSSFEIVWAQITENSFVKQWIGPRSVTGLPWTPPKASWGKSWRAVDQSQQKLS